MRKEVCNSSVLLICILFIFALTLLIGLFDVLSECCWIHRVVTLNVPERARDCCIPSFPESFYMFFIYTALWHIRYLTRITFFQRIPRFSGAGGSGYQRGRTRIFRTISLWFSAPFRVKESLGRNSMRICDESQQVRMYVAMYNAFTYTCNTLPS